MYAAYIEDVKKNHQHKTAFRYAFLLRQIRTCKSSEPYTTCNKQKPYLNICVFKHIALRWKKNLHISCLFT